ncbi:MAG: type II/IV secretion system protein [Pirellulaceae bacterium]|nr:type II/IV secretion system protein [Pirellulaceae bacterium]
MAAETTSTLPPELANIQSLEPREALSVILTQAVKGEASDLFIQPNGNHYAVSSRQMGVVRPLVVVSNEQGMSIVNLIKSAAGLDLAERRHPLDGRWSYQVGEAAFDFRINTIGTHYGEDMVIRLLATGGDSIQIEELGLVGNQASDLRAILNSGSGLLLVTGPVGAGKSTSLYACLNALNDGSKMIITLEDPIEKLIKGIRQCQVFQKIGIGFSELLRGVLRQSPDVIMIGEIRDEETAQTAVRAANSGHLVLSTLHSPLAAGAVASMLAFGVNPYFLANSLVGVVAQHLVRRLSPTSRKAYDVSHSPDTFSDVKDYLEEGQGNVIYGPDVTDPNSQGGYVGQTGLFEVLTVNRKLKELIANSASSAEIHRAALERGMLDFSRAALLKTAQGITGIEDIGRLIPAVELEDYGHTG